MIEPLLVQIGRSTSRSARISATFTSEFASGVTGARLAWRVRGEAARTLDIGAPEDADPYRVFRFDLPVDLPAAARIEYVVAGSNPAVNSPALAADTMFAEGTVRAFSLLPADRPPRIAVVSCNALDDATYREDRERPTVLWRALRERIDAGEVDLVLHVGDQVYADEPIAIFKRRNPAATPADLEREYRRIYLDHFGHRDVRDVLGRCPSLYMWDDHEIFNSYGSGEGDTDPPRLLFHAALGAFRTFQTANNPAPLGNASLAFAQVHRSPAGNTAILALDGRSNRRWFARELLGQAQREQVRAWLRAAAAGDDLAHLIVAVGVPPVFIPVHWLERLLDDIFMGHNPAPDVRDQWTAEKNLDECAAFLGALYEFGRASPRTAITIVAGDVHVGGTAELRSIAPEDAANSLIYEVISSPIAHAPTPLPLFVPEAPIEVAGGKYVGTLRRLPGRNGALLVHRNFAVLGLGPATDPSIAVRFYYDRGGDVKVLETHLPRGAAPAPATAPIAEQAPRAPRRLVATAAPAAPAAEAPFGEFVSLVAFLRSYERAEEEGHDRLAASLAPETRRAIRRQREIAEVTATIQVREPDDDDGDRHYRLRIVLATVLSTAPAVATDVDRCLKSGELVFVAIRYGDAMGIREPVPGLDVGAAVKLRGEWIPAERAYSHGGSKTSVLHFTHHPLGFTCTDAGCYS